MKHFKKNNFPIFNIRSLQSGSKAIASFSIDRLENHIRNFPDTKLPHSHDFYLIAFITQGGGQHTIDFVTYDVESFKVFFVTPGQIHAWEFSKDAKGFVIFFTSSFYQMLNLGQHLYELPFFHSTNKPSCLQMSPQRDARLILMCEEMIDEYNDEQYGRDKMLVDCLDIMLIRMSRYYQETNIPNKTARTSHLRKLEFLIEKYFRELKLPRDFAEKMHITPHHLNEICKIGLNKTLSEIIAERKMLEAKRQLAYTTDTVTKIADDLNFSDKSHFIRFFKKHSGKTPEQFREFERIVHHAP